MTEVLTLPAPAKLNLFLHIVGQREDGYHLLQTLFQMLDLGDELTFAANPSGEIRISPDMPGVPLTDNLIYKAAMLLKPYAPDNAGVDIHIDKRLPMGGGLGGGSSNAATTLLGLNKLWNLHLPNPTLSKLGLQLGADVPVFINGMTAFAEGVGEHLTHTHTPEQWFVVLCPDVHVSTPAVFRHPDLPRNTPAIDMQRWQKLDCRNDCEQIVCSAYPEVAKALDWLVEYAPARMTGTGACVFAAFESEEKARQVLRQRPQHLRGFVAKGTNRSILLEALAAVS